MISRLRAALAVVALGMSGWAALDGLAISPINRLSQHVISDEFLEQLSRIELRGDGVNVQVRRETQDDGATHWITVLPEAGAVESGPLEAFRAALALLRKLRKVPISESQGLLQDARKLSLWAADGRQRVLSFGSETADGRYRWVQIGSEDAATLVQAYLAREVLQGASSLRSRYVISWSPRLEGGTLRLSDATRWLEVGRRTLVWKDETGVLLQAGADASKLQSLLTALRRLSDESCSGSGDSAWVSSTFLDVRQGERLAEIRAGRCLPEGPWREILETLNHPEGLADLHVLPYRGPKDDFLIECAGERREVATLKVDYRSLERFWRQLDSAGVALALAENGATRRVCVLRGSDWQVDILRDDDRWLARVPSQESLITLEPSVAALLSEVSVLFMSPLLIGEEAVFARRIEVGAAGASPRLILAREGSDQPWQAARGETPAKAASSLGERWALSLGMLQAKKYKSFAASQEPKAEYRLQIDFEAALAGGRLRHTILLAHSDARCAVRVDNKPWALLAVKDCDAIWALVPKRD